MAATNSDAVSVLRRIFVGHGRSLLLGVQEGIVGLSGRHMLSFNR